MKLLVFINETSAYVTQSREYGWASSYERVHETRPKGKKERVSLIAATSLEGKMAEQTLLFPDTVNKNVFLAFLETTLLPTLSPGSVIVMDNWSVHHGEEVRELIECFGCELLYLLTYLPDPNPIEYAKLKAFIKALRLETLKLIQAFCNAVKTVTPEQVLNTFKHCG